MTDVPPLHIQPVMALVDWEIVAQLMKLFGDAYPDRLQRFLGHTEGYFASLEAGARTGQTAEMLAILHKLKASAPQFGFLALGRLAAQCEALAREGEDIAPTLAAARACFDASLTQLREKHPSQARV